MNSPAEVWRQHKKLHSYLDKVGKLLVWTKVLVAPQGFEDFVPYFSGIVEFDPAPGDAGRVVRMPVQITDCQEEMLKVGMKLITVIRRGKKVKADEVIEYVVKVRPV